MGHINELLLYLQRVGSELSASESVHKAAWGKHLLEDWKSLSLIADKLREDEPVGEREVVGSQR